ncbi:unnamed protein product [Paramecium octaurelia]|uniref:Uncharacterized protein n=1 Tax=Paramecium octaurelia TaxID=43137 RepID=A0A8S1SU24_PAROT|nr:unnamed protein product [Paramecium octaurelia]
MNSSLSKNKKIFEKKNHSLVDNLEIYFQSKLQQMTLGFDQKSLLKYFQNKLTFRVLYLQKIYGKLLTSLY